MSNTENFITVDKEAFEKLVATVEKNNELIQELKETINGMVTLLNLIGVQTKAI